MQHPYLRANYLFLALNPCFFRADCKKYPSNVLSPTSHHWNQQHVKNAFQNSIMCILGELICHERGAAYDDHAETTTYTKPYTAIAPSTPSMQCASRWTMSQDVFAQQSDSKACPGLCFPQRNLLLICARMCFDVPVWRISLKPLLHQH